MAIGHRQAAELLPWYVNRTLPEEERRELETHLGECLPCRAALRDEQRLQTRLRSGEDSPSSPAHGLADLLGRIDGEGRRGSAAWLRPALAVGAAGAAIILLIVMIGPTAPLDRDGAESFATLTSPADAGADANRLDIVFAEEMDAAEIEALLESFDAELLAGPSELGRYTIAVPADAARGLDELIEEIASEPGVRFVGRNFIPAEPTESGEQ